MKSELILIFDDQFENTFLSISTMSITVVANLNGELIEIQFFYK